MIMAEMKRNDYNGSSTFDVGHIESSPCFVEISILSFNHAESCGWWAADWFVFQTQRKYFWLQTSADSILIVLIVMTQNIIPEVLRGVLSLCSEVKTNICHSVLEISDAITV